MLAFLKLFLKFYLADTPHCIFKTVFEILFGGYATPTKCVAFWRLALNSYYKIKECTGIPLFFVQNGFNELFLEINVQTQHTDKCKFPERCLISLRSIGKQVC